MPRPSFPHASCFKLVPSLTALDFSALFALTSLCLPGDAEYRAADQACGAGEAGGHRVHQQDRPADPGAEAATHGRLLQAAPHCG